MKAVTFIFFLFYFSGNVFGQDPSTVVPSYEWLDDVNLPTVSATDLNTADLTIAIATGPQNFVYVLTFGSGVQKRNADGSTVDSNFITGLDSPLDIAVDENGFIYIADFQAGGSTFEDNGQIKIYDQNGNYIRSILTSYFRPLGVDVRGEKVYIAEYNDGEQGPESTPSSRIRIVDKTSGNALAVNNSDVEVPLRIAVDSGENIYVSHAGDDDPAVLIFNSSLSLQGELSNIQSPGSVVVDDFDFIHVIEYAGRIDFSQFINFANLSFGEIQDIAEDIDDGTDDNAFGIKVYKPNASYQYFFKDRIDFPVDLTFNSCDKMYVDNAEVFGGNIIFVGYIPSRIEFDLEIYERTPSADVTPPEALCISDPFIINLNPGESRTITPEEIDDGSNDLCGEVELFLSKTTFTEADEGDTTVTLTVTDESDQESSCIAIVTVNVEEIEDNENPEITCPSNITENNNSGECGAVVTFADATATDNIGEPTITRIDNTGLVSGDIFPVGTTTIRYRATDGFGNVDECSFTITITDAEDPVISCPDNKVESFDSATGYEVPDFTDEVEVSDNCTSSDDLIITQSPQEGDFITESQVVTITVEDSAGLIDSCTFQLTLEEQQQYELECIGDLTVRLGEDAQNSNVTEIETSEFITSDISNLDLALRVQQFTCEDIGTNSLTIRASDKDTGEEYSCTVTVTVVDVGEPLIICPAGVQTREIPASGVYELPDFAEVYSISDNCSDFEDLVFTQDPLPGTEYTEEGDYEIILTATDVFNNTETCEVTYRLIKSAQPSFECPVVNEIDPIIKNTECDYEVADYSSLITNFQNFSNTPFISSEYVKNEDFLSVSLEVYDGENGNFVGDCVFEVPAIDNTAPNFENCTNRNLSITIAEGSFWNLQDFRDDFTATDNCDADLEYTQDPEPGTPINETTDVAVRVTDGSDNTRSCIFTIDVTVVQGNDLIINCPGDVTIFADENCEYRVPDLSEAINVSNDEAIIEQSLEINSIFDNNVDPYVTVTATFEGESVFCDIYLTPKDEVDPVIECPADETINLGDGERYTLPDYSETTQATDNCGEVTITQQPVAGTEITEDVDVVMTARDSAGNTISCDFRVNIVREGEISISCPEDITAAWDENCEFVLPDYTAQAGINSNGEFEIMQTPAPGTIITAAETEVTISVSDNNSNDSCNFILSLEDNTPPALNLKNTSTAIGSDGIALISFADIDNGSFDNCDSEVNYVLSKLTYTCKNLGENLIQVTAEDSNGNISTGTAVVTIIDEQGFCDDPVIGSEYIFIYPNPNIGSFKIATPADVVIERVEVFDHRGRFIAAKDFESTVTEYSMNLGPLQEAVYVLKIVTNEKTFTKRFIFKY